MVDRSELASVLASFRGRRVTVVGDLMVDEYIQGHVARVSEEAPVPVVGVTAESWGLGGAANVAHQLAALGATVSLVGVVGADDAGERVVVGCEEASIDASGIARDGGRPTTRKLRVVSNRQQIARVDWETTEPVRDDVAAALLDAFDRLDRPEAVVVSDYAKGVVEGPVVGHVTARCREWGVPCLVDPRAAAFDRYAGATVVKANRREFDEARRAVAAAGGADVGASATALLAATPIDSLVVTGGAAGMVVAEADGSTEAIPAVYSDVADVAGAGDTCIAVLALGLAAGCSLVESARVANLAAGAAVRRTGVSVVTAEQVIALAGGGGTGEKLLGLDELASAVQRWRAEGARVVLTNGCFDLLHAGHVHLLESAAAHGDVLVVALNSDESVRANKGESRPVVTAADRAALLGALECVDAIVVFDETTPLQLIERLRPDVLVKGGDYAVDEVVGADAVRAAGGEVRIVPLLAGHSTTALIERGPGA